MAKEITEFVLETLESRNVNRLYFTFSFMHVYPQGYNRDIARCIRHESIVCTTNASHVSTTPTAVRGDGAYTTDTVPGDLHYIYINPDFTFQENGVTQVKKGLSQYELASLRGTIIHEATHALQDYQRNHLEPRESESVAYFAGAITRRQWGFVTPGGISNPSGSAHSYSLHMADIFLAQTSRGQIVVPEDQIRTLKSLVTTGSASRYIANGI